jgi:hypothetical protein
MMLCSGLIELNYTGSGYSYLSLFGRCAHESVAVSPRSNHPIFRFALALPRISTL